MHRFDDAKRYLQQAIDADPNFAPAYEALGAAYLYQGKLAEAKRHLKAAVERSSRNHLAHFYYADALMQEIAGQDGAVSSIPDETATLVIQALQKSIELAPAFADAYERLALVYLIKNAHLEEGIEQLKKALPLHPSNLKLSMRLAELHMRKQDYVQAKEILSKVRKITLDDSLRAQCDHMLEFVERAQSVKTAPVTVVEETAVGDTSSAAETPIPSQKRTPSPELPVASQTTGQKMGDLGMPAVKRMSTVVTGNLISMDCTDTGGFIFVINAGHARLNFSPCQRKAFCCLKREKSYRKILNAARKTRL